jgi:hypothetical protein
VDQSKGTAETMPSSLPIVRSIGARGFFFASVAVMVAIVLWMQGLRPNGLTAIFFVLFARMDFVPAIGAVLILVVAALNTDTSAAALPRWIGAHSSLIAAITLILLCVGALFVYENHPLSMDEYAQFFQSEVFARGRLTGHFPTPQLDWLIPPAFANQFLVASPATGAVVSAYWPSFALLLTPFTALGIAWACNPIISALTLLTVHRLALRLFHSEESAGIAILLTLASPVFFANGISYYSMPAHLLANCVYMLLLLDPSPRRALLAGLVGSVALTLHNPVPHMLFAIPWLLWVATRPAGMRLLGCLIAGYAPLCVLLGIGWFWFLHGLAPSGGSASGASSQMSFIKQLVDTFGLPSPPVIYARTIGLAKICVWAVPGLVVLACMGAWEWRRDHACRALAASAVLTLLGYYLVPFDQGHGWGYRYFHSAWVALPLLAAGVFATRAGEQQRTGIFNDVETRTLVVGCALLTLVFGIGFRAVQMRDFVTFDQQQQPAYAGTEHRVVFLDPNLSFYGADLVQNDPWLRGNVIRMLSRGAEADTTLMRQQFPDMRLVYHDTYGTVWSAAGAQQADTRAHARTP